MNLTSNIKTFAGQFDTYNENVKRKITKALETSAIMVQETAKRSFRSKEERSWPGSLPRVQTGILRNSIMREVSENEAAVFTNTEYASDVEFGTSQTWPHPFLFPALEANRNKILDQLKGALSE